MDKENIKLGLLGIIAITLIVNTFFMDDRPQRMAPIETAIPQSNMAVTPTQSSISTPIINNTVPQTNPAPVAPVILSDTRAKTGIKFANLKHDFGTIQQDSKNTKIFTFTNTGSEPLIIEYAKGSCGCTVPKFPKEPIKPGGTSEIEVIYSPGKQKGAQNKTITITANTNPIMTTLNISANVEEVK